MKKYPLVISDILVPREIIPRFLRTVIRLPVSGLTVEDLAGDVLAAGKVELDVEDALVYARLIRWRHPFRLHSGNYETTTSANGCKKTANIVADKIHYFYFEHSLKRAWNFVVRRNRNGYPSLDWIGAYRRLDDYCDVTWHESIDDLMRDKFVVNYVGDIVGGLDAIRRWYHAAE